jgi:hypothetical protein
MRQPDPTWPMTVALSLVILAIMLAVGFVTAPMVP